MSSAPGWKERIGALKQASFEAASQSSLAVRDAQGRDMGRLIPVGPWIFGHSDAIRAMSVWRQRAMKMFFAQFQSTPERTRRYLEQVSIGEEGRLLFLIYDDERRLVGHVGVSNVDGARGELDNLMRGEAGGSPSLVHFAEVTLLNWCFGVLGLEEIDARVVSYNAMVVQLHEEVGFSLVERSHLFKREMDGEVSHEVVEAGAANVKYSALRMTLTRQAFFEASPWINARADA